MKCGLVDSDGHTIALVHVPTHEKQGPGAAVKRISEVVRETEQSHKVVGQVPHIGLGAPGPMDLPGGLLVAPPQLPSWRGFAIRDAISKATDRPVSFINDANAAAFGEYWMGSASEQNSMLLLTLGTGVGGGIVVEDELINGVNSFGSECGHIIVDPSPESQLCGWGGGRGHLEAYASATGVVLRTLQKLKDPTVHPASVLRQCIQDNPSSLTSKRIYDAAVAGDSLALQIIDETAMWLGIGVTTLVHTIDPGLVILGGAVNFGGAECKVGQRFLAGICEEFRLRTFPNVFEGTTISFATLGSDAGYLGAAGYARKQASLK